MATTSLSKSKRPNTVDGRSSADSGQAYTCVVATGTLIKGNFSSTEPVRLDGSVEGDLHCKEKLVVGSEGVVIGNVKARNIIVKGKIEGDVTAEDHLHLFSTAVVSGTLQARLFSVEEGAVFDGKSQVEGVKR